MGINYLGHFYLTSKLWPILKKSEDLRIINVSSIAHNKIVEKVNLDFSDFNLKRSYQPMKAYCNSKLALTMFTQELASKLSKVSPKARCVCLHPGFVDT
jgi:NAD(P)-dependent dehydrogenase (short-subunit alcohol dehydrogenase family)